MERLPSVIIPAHKQKGQDRLSSLRSPEQGWSQHCWCPQVPHVAGSSARMQQALLLLPKRQSESPTGPTRLVQQALQFSNHSVGPRRISAPGISRQASVSLSPVPLPVSPWRLCFRTSVPRLSIPLSAVPLSLCPPCLCPCPLYLCPSVPRTSVLLSPMPLSLCPPSIPLSSMPLALCFPSLYPCPPCLCPFVPPCLCSLSFCPVSLTLCLFICATGLSGDQCTSPSTQPSSTSTFTAVPESLL